MRSRLVRSPDNGRGKVAQNMRTSSNIDDDDKQAVLRSTDKISHIGRATRDPGDIKSFAFSLRVFQVCSCPLALQNLNRLAMRMRSI